MEVQVSSLFLLFLTLLLENTFCAPIQDDARRDLNPESEERRHHRRRRPCRKDAEGDGKTFFDWNLSYVNVNHNYNYNCGDNSGGGHRPILGGGNRPGGIHGGGIHGGGGGGGHPIFGGGGIHGGSGGGGIHGGGGGIHGGGSGGGNDDDDDHESDDHDDENNHGGGGGGLFGLGLFNWGLFGNHNRPGGNKPQTEKPPTPQYPEVEKPVHEDYDDVLPETYQSWKPGQYITAYNPIFGNYVQDVTNFNPNKIIRQVNRQVNKFFRPLYHLLRKR